jgi:hypothetical protein
MTSGPNAGERVKDVQITEDALSVDLIDGRTISVPLAWYPRLLHATAEQRGNWRIAGGGFGIHWPDLDEDVYSRAPARGSRAARVRVRRRVGALQAGTVPSRLQERMNSPLRRYNVAKSACADSAARRHRAFQAPARPQPCDAENQRSQRRKISAGSVVSRDASIPSVRVPPWLNARGGTGSVR